MYSDPVSFARDTIIKRGIDRVILDLSFGGIRLNGSKKNVAEEIEKLICEACDEFNLLSGDVVDILISKCVALDDANTIYYIPPEVRQNRNVREVLSLRSRMISGNVTGLHTVLGSGGSVMSALGQLGGALNTPYTDGIAHVEMYDTNTFKITTNTSVINTHSIVAVDLENRQRLAKLKKASYPFFYKVVLAYVKSVIYNNRLSISKASIFGGHEIGEIESAISEFSGAGEEYDTYIDEGKVTKMLIFSDDSKVTNLYQQAVKF